jgi:hypothetical protein
LASTAEYDEWPGAQSTAYDPVNSGSCLLRKDMIPIAASVLKAALAKFWLSILIASSSGRS